jgi:hypothetical protein
MQRTRRSTYTLLVVAGAVALSAGVHADELGGLEFDTVDADADGFVTLAEIQAVAPRSSREQLDGFDANSDGRLDRDEYAAWLNNFVGRE